MSEQYIVLVLQKKTEKKKFKTFQEYPEVEAFLLLKTGKYLWKISAKPLLKPVETNWNQIKTREFCLVKKHYAYLEGHCKISIKQ